MREIGLLSVDCFVLKIQPPSVLGSSRFHRGTVQRQRHICRDECLLDSAAFLEMKGLHSTGAPEDLAQLWGMGGLSPAAHQ